MNSNPDKQLIINYLLGICTPREEEEVESWLRQNSNHALHLQKIAEELRGQQHGPVIEKEEVKKRVIQQTYQTNAIKEGRKRQYKFAFSGRSLWIKVAAMLLVAACAGIFSIYYAHEYLTDAEETTVMEQRTLSYGQTASLRFSDGSVIKVNGGSTLRYPERFENDRREVFLEGEAYFSIARNESKPFIVHARGVTIRVLGTSFNIRAYENDDEIQVAVAEGKVEVARKQTAQTDSDTKPVLLREDQWITYHMADRVLEKGEGDIWEMTAWKDQVLVFRNKPFEDVMKMLERWYGVEITLKDPALKSYVLKGEHRDISLQEVLKSIQYVTDMNFTMEENKVTIY